MEGEAFSDSAIAEYLNAHFLPIKVDREERPDIDSIYMQALQMMVGQGGWPLNIFLAPDDLVPFYGGTYFPTEPKYGRSGFLQVLQALRQYFDHETEKVGAVKAEILENLQRGTDLPENRDLSQAMLGRGLGISVCLIQPVEQGNRFPMIPYAIAALRGVRFNIQWEEDSPDSLDLSTRRGLDLALGGIFDHVAGGFHRYTVDPTWTVPHFEKMLYDNGQIVEYLAELWSRGTQEPAFERAIALTAEWLTREMTAPEGYFYAAQDADSFKTPDDAEPEEGAFYAWSYADLQQILDKSALNALADAFTISVSGNFDGQTVLKRRHVGELDELSEMALSTLFQTRYGQSRGELRWFPPARNNQEAKTSSLPGCIPAVTDSKIIVAWNSLMISGLARAAVVFNQQTYYIMAVQAATFILDHQWFEGRLHRLNYEGHPSVLAQSEDYALFIKALLDLYQAAWIWSAAEASWLDAAIKTQAEFDQWLWSNTSGEYYNTASDVSDRLLIRERTYQDSAVPSANGVAIANLVRLSLLTENLSYLDLAEKSLYAFGEVMAQLPRACPSLFTALNWFRHATLADLMTQYTPTAVFKPEDDLPTETVGLVCEGLFCKAPATDWEMLQQQLVESQRRFG